MELAKASAWWTAALSRSRRRLPSLARWMGGKREALSEAEIDAQRGDFHRMFARQGAARRGTDRGSQ